MAPRILVFFAFFAFVLLQAQAQPNNPLFRVFELDGNQDDSPAGGPTDWKAVAFPPALYINDGDGSTFGSGGTKDDYPINTWTATEMSVPPKNNLLNVFAYVGVDSISGHTILCFGGDLQQNGGSANLALWLFQDTVTTANGFFQGVHRDRDLFAVLSYSNGGSTVTATAYQWLDSTNSVSQNRITAVGDAKCNSANPQPFCLITNSAGPISSRFTPSTIERNSFFEGCVDLSVLYTGGLFPCFSTFMLETRSSPEFTAELKDYALGRFNLCGATVTPTCPTIGYSSGAYRVTASVQIQNQGPVAITANIQPTLSDFQTADTRASAVNGVNVPPGPPVTVQVAYNLGATYPSSFTAYFKVTFPGLPIEAKTVSDLCEPAPDFTVASACAAPAAIQFRPNGQLGFGYRATVTVTNTVGGAKSCTIAVSSQAGITIFVQPVSPLSLGASVSSGTFTFDFVSTTAAPSLPSMTITCNEGSFFSLAKSPAQPTNGNACPGYTHDFTASKACTSAPTLDGGVATAAAWNYPLRITVTNTGTGQLWCDLTQPTTSYTVNGATPSLPATNTIFTPTGTATASRNFDFTARQMPSQQNTIGTLRDTAATLSCVNAAGAAVTPSNANNVVLVISSPTGNCVISFTPGIDVTKSCASGVTLPGGNAIQIQATGTVTNTGNTALRLTTSSVFDDRDGLGRGSSTTFAVNLFSDSARTSALALPHDLAALATVYYKDTYTPSTPVVNTANAACTNPSFVPASCLSYPDLVTATAVPTILLNGGSVSQQTANTQTDTAACTSSLCP
jgi:hypothetical protein